MIIYVIIMLLIASANLPFMIKSKKHWESFISFGFTIGLLIGHLISKL